MAWQIKFAESARDDLDGLDPQVAVRIIKKLEWLAQQDLPLVFAKWLNDSPDGHYRFRIGDYRVIFDASNKVIMVRRTGHRSTIYR